MKDDDRTAALEQDYREAQLSPRERAMLNYAVKLTLTPSEMQQADVQQLREVGLSDAAIHDLCQVSAYYNYVNRLAEGLGVELEDGGER